MNLVLFPLVVFLEMVLCSNNFHYQQLPQGNLIQVPYDTGMPVALQGHPQIQHPHMHHPHMHHPIYHPQIQHPQMPPPHMQHPQIHHLIQPPISYSAPQHLAAHYPNGKGSVHVGSQGFILVPIDHIHANPTLVHLKNSTTVIHPMRLPQTYLVQQPSKSLLSASSLRYHVDPPFVPLLPQEPDLNYPRGTSFRKSLTLPPESTVNSLKNKLFAAVKSIQLSNQNHSTFLYELPSNQVAKSLSLETHLNWLIELASKIKNHKPNFDENLLDYFDYIKSNHLESRIALKYDRFNRLIDAAIIRLMDNGFAIPEIVHDLLKYCKNDDSSKMERSKVLYRAFLNNILKFEPTISQNEIVMNMFSTLESLLEYLPIPLDVVLLAPHETNPSIFRTILHMAPLYKTLLAVDSSIETAISLICVKSDGTTFLHDSEIPFTAFDYIFRRAFLFISQVDPDEFFTFTKRFELAAKKFISTFTLDHFYAAVTLRFNYLADAFISFTDEQIDFHKMMVLAYENNSDQYFALKQAQAYLSVFSMDLDSFRLNHKEQLRISSVDEHFILVLEALISATQNIQVKYTFFINWEPNRQFLLLQERIRVIKLDRKDKNLKFHILESPFLFLAAKIFLSRQLNLPVFFFTGKDDLDGFSWADAITYINYHFDRLSTVKIKIKSHFFDDLAANFADMPSFKEIISTFDSKEYPMLEFN